MATESSDRSSKWMEVAAAIILALASLLAAWSSYQAAQWSRTQAVTGNAVVAKLLESTRLSPLTAVSLENQPLADFYRGRFREEFKPAFEAWLDLEPLKNPEAPSSPFAMPEYAPARRQAASDLQEETGGLQQKVRKAAENAEYYVRNTLYLAWARFLVGISRMFSAVQVRGGLQVLALVLLVFGAFNAIQVRSLEVSSRLSLVDVDAQTALRYPSTRVPPRKWTQDYVRSGLWYNSILGGN